MNVPRSPVIPETGARNAHSIEAEQALLGAILVNNQCLDDCMIAADDFFDPLHRHLFALMTDLIGHGRLATPVTLQPAVAALARIGELSVPQYLGFVAARATTTINAPAYANVVRELAQKRAIAAACEATLAAIEDGATTASAMIEAQEAAMAGLGEFGRTSRIVSMSAAAVAAISGINDAYERGDGLGGLSTGLTDLDACLGGLRPGKLVVIAGRPSMGKSALAAQIALAVARTGTHVAFFSQEMCAADIVVRYLAAATRQPVDALLTGRAIETGHWQALVAAAKDTGTYQVTFDETSRHSLASLRWQARRLKRQEKSGLVVVDYLQLMAGNGSGNRNQEISEITAGLKALAGDLQLPVIALSQLSRDNEKRLEKRPQLSDLRDSGAIEQDADAVILVHREEYYLERANPGPGTDGYSTWFAKHQASRGKADLIVAKNRQGASRLVPVSFHGPTTQFGNAIQEEQ